MQCSCLILQVKTELLIFSLGGASGVKFVNYRVNRCVKNKNNVESRIGSDVINSQT